MSKTDHPRPPRDKHAVRMIQERRRSGAAGIHAHLPNRLRSRRAQRLSAIHEQQE